MPVGCWFHAGRAGQAHRRVPVQRGDVGDREGLPAGFHAGGAGEGAEDHGERRCECQLCELSFERGGLCPYCNKLQRHPPDLQQGGLGLCPKLQAGWEERARRWEAWK